MYNFYLFLIRSQGVQQMDIKYASLYKKALLRLLEFKTNDPHSKGK